LGYLALFTFFDQREPSGFIVHCFSTKNRVFSGMEKR